MKTLAIVGAQWGDEGKGKITDYLSAKFDLVVRYQGGNNAGHTIWVGDKKVVLHHIPSGVLHPHCVSVMAQGMVISPRELREEMEGLKKDINLGPERLKISKNCFVITPYHKILDRSREGDKEGNTTIGTTCKGIGPCYEDKISRKGIRPLDILNRDVLIKKLDLLLAEKRCLFENLYKVDFPSVEEVANELQRDVGYFEDYLVDTFCYIQDSYEHGKKILFEGAQGVLLDIEYGTYPFVTSSYTTSNGIACGTSFDLKGLDNVLGITKAYTTRVGEGPFPTEQLNEVGSFLQENGHEFGATTGRRRRCGYLDLPLLKYSAKVSNLTSLALTKLDVLCGLEDLKVCTHYEVDGKRYDCAFPGLDWDRVTPIYRQVDSFLGSNKLKEDSPFVVNYVGLVEKEIGLPVKFVGIGPERNEMILR